MSAVGFQSDSQLLVDTCLARLRIDARLDDDPILPTIDLLPSDVLIDVEVDEGDDDEVMDVDESELVIVCRDVKDVPSAASIVRQSVKANRQEARERPQKEVPTLRKIRSAASTPMRVARWPVMLCALVAMYCGTTAVLKSPLGAKPEVQRVVKVSRGHIQSAIKTTKSLVRL